MSKKKHNLFTLLRNYNKKYGTGYGISSDIEQAYLTYDKQSNVFSKVFYIPENVFGDRENTSMEEFIYKYVNSGASKTITKHIKGFIRGENNGLKVEIKILPPNKIRYAYLYTNYFSKEGNLGNSCMKNKENQKALNFYVKNNVRIVVAIDKNKKIHARALLWDNVKSTQLKNPFTYLDRVYTRSDRLLPLFYDLAKQNSWKSYGSSSAGKAKGCYYINNIYINNIYYFPYTDTFRYLFYKEDIIVSGKSDPIMKKIKHRNTSIVLVITGNGGYFRELDPNSVQEVLTGNYISKKDAIKVKRYNGYVSKDNIADINGDYYSTHDSAVVHSPLDKFILSKNLVNEVFTNVKIDKTKAILSPNYNKYIHKTNVIRINKDIYHKQDTDIICWNDKEYHISQCFINYDREKRNAELTKKQYHFWIDNEIFIPYPANFVTRKDSIIPKEHVIIAYNLSFSPVLNNLEYQKVYLPDDCLKNKYIILNTGVYIINSSKNKQHLKKFNNKWYIKQKFEAPNKKQLMLF